MRTCRLATLGCKVNQYETQYVKEALELNGYREAGEGEPADLCVVNTCTVTREGDAKSRQLIRRLHQEQPRAAILVMGCYATRAPETVRRLPGVAQVIPDKQRLSQELQPWGVQRMPRGIQRFDGHQRAFVKVQDGCLLRCTYCIIPSVRPTLISRPLEEVRDEVLALISQGYQEIVLTGVHLGHYGIDVSKGKPKAQWARLWNLLRILNDLPGQFRIRLSSLEAAEARDDLVRAMAELPRVVPHLHLCLQSGSDRILHGMRRRYRAAGFLERCRRIRQALDQPAFTTDVIVGFPGETEEDFQQTLRVVREAGFCKVHVFSYSTREGTPAAAFLDIPSPSVVADRRERLRALADELGAIYAQSLVDRTLDVIVEGEDPARPGRALGTSCRALAASFPGYVPALVGKRVLVQGTAVAGTTLLGDPAPDSEWRETGISGPWAVPVAERIPLPLAK